ncbi:MAG: hypothetical protein EOO46_10205 [Flavobacterium sp.]|nr:MAG: hypothetical protein EOO46_10205 [Flavobacterium sp.]
MAGLQISDSRQLLLCSNPDHSIGRVINGSKKSHIVYTISGLLHKDYSTTTHLSIRLLHAELPHSLYVFTEDNNLLRIITATDTYDVEITEGNYNGESLINFLNTWFNTNAPSLGMVSSLSSIDGKVTMTASLAFSISANSTCGNQMGFDSDLSSVYDSSLAKYVAICPYLLDLSGVFYLLNLF